MKARTLYATGVDLLLSRDPRLRLRCGLTLLATLLYASWIVLELLGLPQGLFIDARAGRWVIAAHGAAALGFYPLVRSGKTLPWRDPSMVLAQMVLASVLVALNYALCPDLRLPLLQAMCLVQLFGLFNLSPRAVQISGVCAVAALLLMLALATALALPQFDPLDEALCIVLTCFVLALLSRHSHGLSRVRESVRLQKQALGKAVEQVNKVLMHDTLTGLYNRRHMQGLLEREYARSRRSGLSHSIAVIDLDHFKQVNEAYGPRVGDEVLASFAKIAREALRETDLIARWGGEEFLVLMPNTHPAQHAEIGLSRLRQALSRRSVSSSEPQLRISFSAGIAIHLEGQTLDQTLDRACTALARAKALGRDRSILATDSVPLSFPSTGPAALGMPA